MKTKNPSLCFRRFIKRHTLLHKLMAPAYLNYKRHKKLFYRFIDKNKDNKKLMVDIGGGTCFHRHWRIMEFPSEWYKRSELVGIDYEYDLTSQKQFPFPDNWLCFVFSANTFEHVPQEFCQWNFNEIYRCLKLGGAFRIQVPDIDCAYNAFGKRDKEFFSKRFPSPGGMEEAFLYYFAAYLKNKISLKEIRRNYSNMEKERFLDFYTKQIPRESQKRNAGNHINWWDYDKLSKMLIKAGFKTVYRSAYKRSRFPEMKDIDSTHPETSLFMEAIK